MWRFLARLTVTCLMLVAGCGQQEDQADSGEGAVTSTAPPPTEAAHDQHASIGDTAAGQGGETLLVIMRRLGSEMTSLTHALVLADFPAVERHAAAIAEHAPIAAGEVERIHTILGSDMAGFEAVDESVHVASVGLHEAAEGGQPELVIERLGEVQRGCVSCHTQFRERLLTNSAEQ